MHAHAARGCWLPGGTSHLEAPCSTCCRCTCSMIVRAGCACAQLWPTQSQALGRNCMHALVAVAVCPVPTHPHRLFGGNATQPPSLARVATRVLSAVRRGNSSGDKNMHYQGAGAGNALGDCHTQSMSPLPMTHACVSTCDHYVAPSLGRSRGPAQQCVELSRNRHVCCRMHTHPSVHLWAVLL